MKEVWNISNKVLLILSASNDFNSEILIYVKTESRLLNLCQNRIPQVNAML